MMKSIFNRLHLRKRHRNQNPNPNDTLSPPSMLPQLASGSGSGDGREEEAASSSSTAKTTEDERESPDFKDAAAEIEDEQQEQIVDEEQDGIHKTESLSATELDGESSKSLVVVGKDNALMRMEKPPADDCCPICFSNFVVPCRGPCGHWYCGGCILQYWNYTAALQPCNCPMCSMKITDLTPEASLYSQQDAEVIEILKKVRKYNRLFMGGAYGLMLKVLGLPFCAKRVFNEMMNPDRPGAHLNKLRIFAMFLGLLYTLSPFDFLQIGRQNVIDVFDYSAIALSSVLYLVGLYLQRRRFRHVRDMAAENFDAAN